MSDQTEPLCENKDLQMKVELARLEVEKLRLKIQLQESCNDGHSSVSSRSTKTVSSKRPKAPSNVCEYVQSLPKPTGLGDCPPPVEGFVNRVSVDSLSEIINACVRLPRKEIERFSGEPLSYWRFIRGFETNIARCMNDPSACLTYLISYCSGEALESIQHCTILEPDVGYNEARRILERRFGEPYTIARSYINMLIVGDTIGSNDATALTKLAEQTHAAELTLSQLNYLSELNSSRSVGLIVSRLLQVIQFKWFETAAAILGRGR